MKFTPEFTPKRNVRFYWGVFARIRDMKRLPFSIFKRSNSRYYYVKFKNEETGDYLPAISTKQESEVEASKIAFEWLRTGIPQQGGNAVSFKQYSLRDMAKASEISKDDSIFICKELQRRGLLKSYIVPESKNAVSFSEFLQNFWDWEISV